MPTVGLISLQEWNELRLAEAELEKSFLRSNSIACPLCQVELLDSGTWAIHGSQPYRNIECPACSFTGMRIA